MTKNSNRGLIIAVIALLCTVVLLLTAFMGYVIFTNSSHLGFFDWNRETKVLYDESFDSADISKIIVTSELGDVDIKQSNDNKIRVVANGYDEKLFNLNTEASTLMIDSKTKNHKTKIFNPFGDLSNLGMEIDIYLPAGCPQALVISSNLGDIKIDTPLTDIELKVSCDMGNIKAESISGTFDLNTDMGDIKLERINITADSSATTDMGDIEIEHTNDIKVNYSTSMGECEVKNSNSSSAITLTAETSMGDVEIG